ncbi:TrlF family AAA-like ATPase [Reyranella sp.]|uniref:TrlF family AAA-like ATPase n=1 Tax=Reyranella sp. TaxID=1929291 RepID=UPI003D0D37D8
MPDQSSSSNSGSQWQRWDPHVHGPGTTLNDQFKGDWNGYLQRLESADPSIRAIGVTDYYGTELYERVVAEKQAGRLRGCELIFPNIEMRLDKATVKDRWVNIHLLVDPSAPDALNELKRFLQNLTFRAHGDTYHCNRDDLIRLGRKANPALKDDKPAHAFGAQQFKVSFDELRRVFIESDWAKDNVLIAIAGGETDGTSGVRAGADATLRQEVERFAHVIFASSVAQREYWLGMRPSASPDDIRNRYGALKPCMHGSDAHDTASVGQPAANRFSWIKGKPTFDTLRQACIDPASRAYVGETPPSFSTPSQIISSLTIDDAPWIATPRIVLNSGLVAIVGPRGSGKTALADVIAKGCDATDDHLTDASFLVRAQELLGNASVTLNWAEGEPVARSLDGSDQCDPSEYPRARYLSQKFVEELCSADGVTDELLSEIERVIFEAHSVADRNGALSFDELRDIRTAGFREARERDEETLANISEHIGTELEKIKLVPGLKKQIEEKTKLVDGYTKDRAKLVAKGSEKRVERLNELTAASSTVQGYIRFFTTKQASVKSIQGEVLSYRTAGALEDLRQMKLRHQSSAFAAEDWTPFLRDYKGDVNAAIAKHLGEAQTSTTSWKGTPPPVNQDVNVAYIADDADLKRLPLAVLEAEIGRLQKIISIDKQTADRFAAITKRITEESSQLDRLKEQHKDCEGALERVKALIQERETTYQRVFEAILAEEAALRDLYGPLMQRLSEAGSTLSRLSFAVTRRSETNDWAAAGEALLDLRKQGAFRGKGTLEQLAKDRLVAAWEAGDAKAVSAAMATFREKNQKELLDNAPVPKSEQANYRDWLKRFAKWLYGTDHIRLQYSIDYNGVDIRKLSPGTRGIILLLLYLALDDHDDRPLIIDQPEENLDPKSVFDELVGLFLMAKTKRQVIMVTHNANLVVNTDADQIIIAHAEPREAHSLPRISYMSGGLEEAGIRKAVCDILEGGDKAFQERARRLRVSLARAG